MLPPCANAPKMLHAVGYTQARLLTTAFETRPGDAASSSGYTARGILVAVVGETPVKVLFDIAEVHRGGMERQMVALATGLVARGHEVALVVNKEVRAYHEEIAASGASAWTLGRLDRWDLRVATDLVRVMRLFAPDVVVAESFTASLWARLAATACGTAVVVAEHAADRKVRLSVYLTNRVLGHRTQVVVACSTAQVPSLVREGHRSDRIVVVRNGVDTDCFTCDEPGATALRRDMGVADSTFLVGMVAAHRPEKRHDRLIQLVEDLTSDGADVAACAVGDGPLVQSNRALAAASPAAARMFLLGPRRDLAAVYSACDVVVLMSDAVEAFPLCLLESQACGTPVVAMSVGGVAETFGDGTTGLLVGQGDMVSMVSAVNRLRLDVAMRQMMGKAAADLVRNSHNLDKMVKEYERVLQGAIHAHRKSQEAPKT
jgi:glycosyltransferase involved in cell wall biosynthesis